MWRHAPRRRDIQCAARESVNRQLQLWRKDGILDLQRGRILLLNMGRLTAVARNE